MGLGGFVVKALPCNSEVVGLSFIGWLRRIALENHKEVCDSFAYIGSGVTKKMWQAT